MIRLQKLSRPVVALAIACTVLAPPDARGTTFDVLHELAFDEGKNVYGAMVVDAAGVLYGTAEIGGRWNYGTLFKLDGPTLTVLHTFNQAPDTGGAVPMGDLMTDRAGTIYGTTSKEGKRFGTIFKYDEVQGFELVYTFKGGEQGGNPAGGLLEAGDGQLYGTTSSLNDSSCAGGGACGTVFRFDPATLSLQTIHTFTGPDGAYPMSTPALSAGRLYTTTTDGSEALFFTGSPASMKPNGKHFSVIATDGGSHFMSGLARDKAGNLWGVAALGGASGNGTIYRIDPDGVHQTMFNFSDTDGRHPQGTPVFDRQGRLYGITSSGGAHHLGVVWRYVPKTGVLTTLHDFSGGAGPRAGLTIAADGTLYGSTWSGNGANPSNGTIWRLVP